MKTQNIVKQNICSFVKLLLIYTNLANALNCDGIVSPELKTEIQGYQETANKIIETVISGSFKGRTYKDTGAFVDQFGPRFPGTKALEKSIDWALDRFAKDKLENVKTEDVKVIRWVRGQENAMMVTPREKVLKIFGLGLGVATPLEGIYAQAIVVRTFDELEKRKNEVPGKIVVFNQEYGSDYYITVSYRNRGPSKAASLGAIAALVRSITPFSINSPHTGQVYYDNGTTTKQIPCGAIAPEDAMLLWRLDQSGHNITIKMNIQAHFETPTNSRNIWGDYKGTEKADKLLLSSCHIDSWDIGEGVMDDAGGCMLSLETLNIFQLLGLRPKRTLRIIWFTSEELSMTGAREWVAKHMSELDTISAIMESDHGLFKPLGLDYIGVEQGACIVQEVLNLAKALNVTQIKQKEKLAWTTQLDLTAFSQSDVPAILLNATNEKYMWFHHSEGDTLSVYTPDEVDQCLAVWAVAMYVIADLSVEMPRK